MGTKMKKVKKKRLNIARTLVFILFIYIIVCVGLYIYEEPVSHYEISGTEVLTDIEIICVNDASTDQSLSIMIVMEM